MTTNEKKRRGRPSGHNDEVKRFMQRIIDYIDRYSRRENIAPTLREICLGLKRPLSDIGNIQRLIQELIAEGYLKNAGTHNGRSLSVVKPRKTYFKADQTQSNL